MAHLNNDMHCAVISGEKALEMHALAMSMRSKLPSDLQLNDMPAGQSN